MDAFLQYLTLPYLLRGAVIALEVAAGSLIGGLLLGLGLALMREAPLRPLKGAAWVYVWVFRGTPILLQLVFWYDALPRWGLTLPAIPTAILGFSLNAAAFMSETIRGGIHSVDATQTLAAEAMGMGRLVVMRRVVLPQAMRAIIPPFGNETIGLLKNTSLASVIAVDELTLRSQQIVAANFNFFAVFTAAGVMYLIMTTVLSIVQNALERRFDLYRAAAQARRSSRPRWLAFGSQQRKVGIADIDLPSEMEALEEEEDPPNSEKLHGALATVYQEETTRPARQYSDNNPTFLVCRKVEKRYGANEVLKGVSLTVASGEVLVIIGRSGSGKSTLLRLINHLEVLDDGEILLEGEYVGYRGEAGSLTEVRDLARARANAKIGIVFQQFNLFGHMTAIENVMASLVYVYGVTRDEARRRGEVLLASVGLGGHLNHLPHRLSGGQQQRVAIARALAPGPRLMLLDEPTSALDPALTEEVRIVVRKLAEEGMTMVVATHDMHFASDIADKLVFMEEGRIVEQGIPEELLQNPSQPETRRFLRLMSS